MNLSSISISISKEIISVAQSYLDHQSGVVWIFVEDTDPWPELSQHHRNVSVWDTADSMRAA